jgi:magnesium transporter
MLYRVINSDKIPGVQQHIAYYKDIHDHLLKLTDMIESNREMTADLRDSYDSIRSSRMNMIMKTLTVITTIFMPLTFIVGVYGMNFHYMPELGWHWGYFTVLGLMAALGVGMYVWFRRKGWFD